MAISSSDRSQRGVLGEQLVAQWLQQTGWHIIATQWHCRWGEIDLIAWGESLEDPVVSVKQRSRVSPTLAFIEVKTRSQRNWDQGGRQAIRANKQRKLWQTAELFLSEYPQFSQITCRFDVALVTCESLKPNQQRSSSPQPPRPQSIGPDVPPFPHRPAAPIFPKIEPGQPIRWNNYSLTLQQYIPHAFCEI